MKDPDRLSRISTDEELELLRFLDGWVIPAGTSLFVITWGGSLISGFLLGWSQQVPFFFVVLGLLLLVFLPVCGALTASHVQKVRLQMVDRLLKRKSVRVLHLSSDGKDEEWKR